MTAVSIWDNIRDVIEQKREEIYRKHGRRPTQMDVASAAIIHGLDNVEEELGFVNIDKKEGD